MKKKGFTLIEIIICISLLVVIGVGSFVGIRLVNKNITIEKLEQIKDKILLATEVYIETNQETYNKLYNEKNGVMIPLNVLVNEGLLDITGTKLDDKEIENNYVISMLSPGTGGSSDDCVDIKTVTSWNETSNEPLFICVDENGNSNLAVIDPIKYANLTTAATETYWFKGPYPNNYVQYGDSRIMRIISVDIDDSLTVAGFGDVFGEESVTKTDIFNSSQVVKYPSAASGRGCSNCWVDRYSYRSKCDGASLQSANNKAKQFYGGFHITPTMYYNTEICTEESTVVYPNYSCDAEDCSTHTGYTWLNNDYRYLVLKPCMKITSGTGTYDNPYILEQKGTC